MRHAINLPLLTALPAFEASARLRSFTRAAEHLNLTQSAVSFQVRKLETELGLPLFVRGQRTLALTAEGARFLSAVDAAFEILRTERAALASANSPAQFVLSVSFSLSTRWLVPRLHLLRERLGDTDLRIDTNDRTVDLVREGVDMAVRYCTAPPQGLNAEHLFQDHVFPVCAPTLLDAFNDPRLPADLAGVTLLHDNMTDLGWPEWIRSAGEKLQFADRGPRFSHTAGAIDAAVSGHGIALGRTALVADDLKAGRLVRPFDHVACSDYTYYALWPEKPRRSDQTQIVLDELRAEAERSRRVVFGCE